MAGCLSRDKRGFPSKTYFREIIKVAIDVTANWDLYGGKTIPLYEMLKSVF